MSPEHTIRAYDEELEALTTELSRMGATAEAELADAVRAIARRDIALAQAVVARDAALDEMEADIERRAIRLIALRQPVADDLRRTVAALKISTNLERCGDLAKNIAKRVLLIAESDALALLTRSIERMGELVAARLREVLDAFSAGDLDRARSVWQRDQEVDRAYESIFHELLTCMMGDPRTIASCAHLLFVAKNLERIGDHATNIAEITTYEITGEYITEERPKLDPLERWPGAHAGGVVQPYVLVAEAEQALAALLHYNLDKEGYRVDLCGDGDEALVRVAEKPPDLLVLDWTLPGVSGIEVCRRLRQRPATRNLPIIMVTARADEADRVRGLDTGADDYIVKPFMMSELCARIRAVLRRIRPGLVEDRIRRGDIVIDRSAHRVRRAGKEVHLGPTEFRLLDYLMQHPGRVFSREQLLDGVWGSEVYVETRTVDVHIGRLRRALAVDEAAADPIRTVRSAGYALDLE